MLVGGADVLFSVSTIILENSTKDSELLLKLLDGNDDGTDCGVEK